MKERFVAPWNQHIVYLCYRFGYYINPPSNRCSSRDFLCCLLSRVHRSQWGNLRLSRQIATSEVQFLIKDERFVQKRPSDLSRSRSLLSSAPLFVEFHPGGEYCRDVEGRGISQADSHPAPLAVAQNVEPRYPTRPKRHPKQLSLGFPYRPWT